ncbi:MAG: DUF4340 domain-containing protein [Gemmatimonadetes bacterium]|nr:DUF4340 domain-containing protein [Gemmatimonadota bacterium]
MSTNALKRLATVLAALFVVWLALSMFRRAGRDAAGSFAMPKVDAGAVDGISIVRSSDTIRFAKSGTGWTVNGLAAGATLVAQLFEALTDTTSRSELVAEAASSHPRLGIDSAGAKRLQFRQGEQLQAEVLVGSRGSSWESAYLRLPGQNQVYQVKGRLFELIERQVDDWRDKRIAAVEPDSVVGVEIVRPKETVTLAKAGTAWTVDGAAADSGAVASLLSQYRALDAGGFPTQGQIDSADFAKPDLVIRLKGAGERVLAAIAIDSAAAGFWTRREGNPTTFRLDSWVISQLAPGKSTLTKK